MHIKKLLQHFLPFYFHHVDSMTNPQSTPFFAITWSIFNYMTFPAYQ